VSWQAVVKLSEIREHEIYPANVDGIDLILMRHGDGVAAYLDSCPHEGAQLSFGQREGDVLICARHLWEFDVRSGEHISRVPRPQFDLKKAAVRVVGDQVEVDVAGLE
jgi:nitrite reductase/ring-hydroxylating ferredoxin subunit